MTDKSKFGEKIKKGRGRVKKLSKEGEGEGWRGLDLCFLKLGMSIKFLYVFKCSIGLFSKFFHVFGVSNSHTPYQRLVSDMGMVGKAKSPTNIALDY